MEIAVPGIEMPETESKQDLRMIVRVSMHTNISSGRTTA